MKWSNPPAGLQYDQFNEYVKHHVAHGVSERKVVDVAAVLCEWSRTFYNQAFGRINPQEVDRVTELFYETAAHIREWAHSVSDVEELGKIGAYADHIQQRTGLRKV